MVSAGFSAGLLLLRLVLLFVALTVVALFAVRLQLGGLTVVALLVVRLLLAVSVCTGFCAVAGLLERETCWDR